MCAIVFLSFTFIFLYSYQSQTLLYTQHTLSGGKTHYDILIGGIIITSLVILLQSLTSRWLKLGNHSYALTYAPSAFMLILLTDVRINSYDSSIQNGLFIYWLPLALFALFMLIKLAKQWIPKEQKHERFLSSSYLLSNLLIMLLLIAFTCFTSNNDNIFKSRIKAEQALIVDNNDDIIKVTTKANIADSTLTLYRAIALDNNNTIADSMFHCPVIGNRASLYYPYENNHRLILPMGKLREHKPSKDYRLCSLLLECQLDAFAHELTKYYTINDSLPTHYKEALVLYQHQRSTPITNYHDEIMEINYDSIQIINHKYKSENERNYHIHKTYNKTYWQYYFLHNNTLSEQKTKKTIKK